jgi:hypothetical protein
MASTSKPNCVTRKPPDAEPRDQPSRDVSRIPAPDANRRIIINVQNDVLAVTQVATTL